MPRSWRAESGSYSARRRIAADGRVGHGVKSRVSSVYKAKDKVAGYRSMINHQFSKALVAYAEKNGYGTIQMEDLTGIKEDAGYPKKLRHWTYYDLQTKIEYKAKERGIAVRRVNPPTPPRDAADADTSTSKIGKARRTLSAFPAGSSECRLQRITKFVNQGH